MFNVIDIKGNSCFSEESKKRYPLPPQKKKRKESDDYCYYILISPRQIRSRTFINFYYINLSLILYITVVYGIKTYNDFRLPLILICLIFIYLFLFIIPTLQMEESKHGTLKKNVNIGV